MSELLLATKLYVPQPHRGLVPRPRLIERLNAGLGQDGHVARRLTLVSAPAGFGKTTLLSEWVRGLGLPLADGALKVVDDRSGGGRESRIPNQGFKTQVAWLSLDEGDNDPGRFLSYLISALQTVHADVGEAALAVLQSTQQPSVQAILTSLINEISTVARPVVLILDDYHVIKVQPVDRAVAFLLEHSPPNLHLVIASRADPFLPLSRLRARGQMLELRTDDLRFSPQEAATFLNQVMGLGLSGDDVAALGSRTEGWITGLHLAALSMQDRKRSGQDPASFVSAFAGEDRYIVDYLVDEVLAQQPEGTYDFLLKTSILDRMTGPLCDDVTGQESGQQVLERLEQANLFVVPLDSQRRWYRYHHLFADLLRHRLRATYPEGIPELYRRASTWYEAEGDIEVAIRYALAAEDEERAARLLDEIAFTLIARSEFKVLFRWINALPETTRQRYPRLYIAYAWALQFARRLDAVEPILALAERHLKGAACLKRLVTAHSSAIRSYVARRRRDYAHAAELSHQALKTLSADPSDDTEALRGAVAVNLGIVHSRLGQVEAADEALLQAIELNRTASNPFAMMSSVTHLMRLRICQGQLRQAKVLGRQGLEWIAGWRGEGATRSGASAREVHTEMSRVLYEWSDLSRAADHVQRAREFEELAGLERPATSQVMLVYLHQALGNPGAALEHLEKIAHFTTPTHRLRISARLQAQITRAQILMSRRRPDRTQLLASAIRWAKDAGLKPADDFGPAREGHYATLVCILMAQNKPGEALSLLKRLCQAATSTACSGDMIKYLIWRSLAHQALAQPAPALSSLNQALVLAQPEGYVRSFVDEGEPMADLLSEAASRDVAPDYVTRLLAAFAEPTKDQRRKTKADRSSLVLRPSSADDSPSSALVEPLSERERQVLQLLRTDLSGPEIAEKLMVSVNTVRFHTKNIYGKLGVNSRRQAVARAESLGLL